MQSLVQIDLARTLAHEKPRLASGAWACRPADRSQMLRLRLRRRHRFRFRLLFPQRTGRGQSWSAKEAIAVCRIFAECGTF